jgi:hypothetical protein
MMANMVNEALMVYRKGLKGRDGMPWGHYLGNWDGLIPFRVC